MRRTTAAVLFALSLLGTPVAVTAHTAWLEEDPATPGVFRVLFGGHAGQLETLEPGKITSVLAYAADGKAVSVERSDGNSGSRVTPGSAAVLIAMSYDNGIWSRDPMGRSVNKPMSEVSGAQQATWALKHHKSILKWSSVVTEPLGQAFEVVPLSGEVPIAGRTMRVQVLLDGNPVAGVRLGRGEEGEGEITDGEGVASFIPRPGFNRLWAGRRMSVDAPGYTELSYEYLLTFEALAAE
ncbi:MAG: DUF4198 domain-containing protein [Pseudomonadota bacterium]